MKRLASHASDATDFESSIYARSSVAPGHWCRRCCMICLFVTRWHAVLLICSMYRPMHVIVGLRFQRRFVWRNRDLRTTVTNDRRPNIHFRLEMGHTPELIIPRFFKRRYCTPL